MSACAARERDSLRQLLVDTWENEHRLTQAIADDSTTRASLRHRLTLPVEESASADTLLATLSNGRVFSASDFQLIAGIYGALLATGALRLVRGDHAAIARACPLPRGRGCRAGARPHVTVALSHERLTILGSADALAAVLVVVPREYGSRRGYRDPCTRLAVM